LSNGPRPRQTKYHKYQIDNKYTIRTWVGYPLQVLNDRDYRLGLFPEDPLGGVTSLTSVLWRSKVIETVFVSVRFVPPNSLIFALLLDQHHVNHSHTKTIDDIKITNINNNVKYHVFAQQIHILKTRSNSHNVFLVWWPGHGSTVQPLGQPGFKNFLIFSFSYIHI